MRVREWFASVREVPHLLLLDTYVDPCLLKFCGYTRCLGLLASAYPGRSARERLLELASSKRFVVYAAT